MEAVCDLFVKNVQSSSIDVDLLRRHLAEYPALSNYTISHLDDPPLIRAVKAGDWAATELLLAHSAEPSSLDKHGNTALHWAACLGFGTIARQLLQMSLQGLHHRNELGHTPLEVAVNQFREELVVVLLEYHDMDVDKSALNGSLIATAANGNEHLCSKLLNHRADPNFASVHGDPPLLMAAFYNHLSVVDHLLAANANASAVNSNGDSALTIAASQGNLTIMRLLLTRSTDLLYVVNKLNNSPLDCAIWKDQIEAIKFLLSVYEATPTSLQDSKRNCDIVGNGLLSAVHRGDLEMVSLLIGQRPRSILNVDYRPPGSDETALIIACRGLKPQSATIARRLLLANASVTLGTCNESLLMMAMAINLDSDRLELLNTLVDHGAGFYPKEITNGTALVSCVEAGHEYLVKWLINSNADVNVIAETVGSCQCTTALQLAASTGNLAMIDLLMDNGASITGGAWTTPLIAAVSSGNLAALERMLNHRCARRLRDLAAFCEPNPQLGRWMATVTPNRGPIRPIDLPDAECETALSTAVAAGNEAIVRLLLRHEASVHPPNRCCPPLVTAVARGYLGIVELLLEAGASPNTIIERRFSDLWDLGRSSLNVDEPPLVVTSPKKLMDKHPVTVLMLAANCCLNYANAAAIVESLITAGAWINATSDCFGAPLHRSCIHGDVKVTELLLRLGANPVGGTDLDPSDASVFRATCPSPLHYAARFGHLEICQRLLPLLSSDAINALDPTRMYTPLMLALQHGHHELVEWLLAHPAVSVSMRNTQGDTALTMVCRALPAILSDREVALLIKRGSNVNAANAHGTTALMGAAITQNFEVTQLLIQSKAHVNAEDSCGRSALVFSIIAASSALQPDVYFDKGAWSLFLCIGSGKSTLWSDYWTTYLLLDSGASVEPLNPLSMPPIKAAALVRSLPLAKILLERGANPYPEGTSALATMLTRSRELPTLLRELNWSHRLHYVSLLDQNCQDDHISRYLLNEFVARDVCSYLAINQPQQKTPAYLPAVLGADWDSVNDDEDDEEEEGEEEDENNVDNIDNNEE